MLDIKVIDSAGIGVSVNQENQLFPEDPVLSYIVINDPDPSRGLAVSHIAQGI